MSDLLQGVCVPTLESRKGEPDSFVARLQGLGCRDVPEPKIVALACLGLESKEGYAGADKSLGFRGLGVKGFRG